MSRLSLLAPLFVAVGCGALLASSAYGDDGDGERATARRLAQDGYDALRDRKFSEALELFRRAGALHRAPMITLGLARAEVGLGRLVAAQEHYQALVHESLPPGSPMTAVKAIEDARSELTELEPRVPTVVLALRGPETTRVTLDGAVVPGAALGVPRPVDPGAHSVLAEAVGFRSASASFTLVAGQHETVPLALEPLPKAAARGAEVQASAPGSAAASSANGATAAVVGATTPEAAATSPRDASGGAGALAAASLSPTGEPRAANASAVPRTLGFVGLGVGGAALVASAVTGGLALAGQPSAGCASTAVGLLCEDAAFSEQTRARELAWVSTATAIAGGLLAAGGATLVLLTPSGVRAGEAPPTATLRIAPTGFVVEARF